MISGSYYRRHLAEAVQERAKHTGLFDNQCANLPPEKITLWTEQVKRWEEDHTADNPYAQTEEGEQSHGFGTFLTDRAEISLAQVRQTIAAEEQEEAEAGVIALHKISSSALILWGLRIEEQQ